MLSYVTSFLSFSSPEEDTSDSLDLRSIDLSRSEDNISSRLHNKRHTILTTLVFYNVTFLTKNVL